MARRHLAFTSGYGVPMPSCGFLLDVVTREPTSTSDLYARAGYTRLLQHGLIPYPAFRDALSALRAEGLVQSQTGEDGATLWRLAPSAHPPHGGDLAD